MTGEAGDEHVVDEVLHGTARRGSASQDRAVDEVAGQHVPEVLGDGGGLDLATVDGPGEDVLHEGFALVEELLLHHGVELGAPGDLHEHRPNGARMGADVSADLLSQSQQIAAQRAGVGSTATCRVPSTNAANTSSALVGHRR